MVIRILLVLLQISFTAHIYFLIQYVLRREGKSLRRFINTAISNIVLAGALTILVIFRPDLIRNVNLQFLLWIMAGLIMVIMIMIKVTILRNMYRRSQDPANYHFNFFGKKFCIRRSFCRRRFIYPLPFRFSFCEGFSRARSISMFDSSEIAAHGSLADGSGWYCDTAPCDEEYRIASDNGFLISRRE